MAVEGLIESNIICLIEEEVPVEKHKPLPHQT